MKTRDKNGNELKVGDLVERIEDEWGGMNTGDTGVITVLREDGIHVEIKGYKGGQGVSHLVKVREENEI